jgi:hypothetical protein
MVGNVIDMAKVRRRRRSAIASPQAGSAPSWSEDIHTCCGYARMLRAEHEAERARIRFEQLEPGT